MHFSNNSVINTMSFGEIVNVFYVFQVGGELMVNLFRTYGELM